MTTTTNIGRLSIRCGLASSSAACRQPSFGPVGRSIRKKTSFDRTRSGKQEGSYVPMPSIKTIADSLYDAVRCLPTELCRLTAAYATGTPHTWTSIEVVSVTTISNATEIDSRDNLHPFPWRTLVSATTLATGLLTWTVEFVLSLSGNEWIGAGVTLSSENRPAGRRCTIQDIATDDDWLLMPFHQNTVGVGHNGRLDSVVTFDQREWTSIWFRLEFVADPVAETVSATVWRSTDGIVFRQDCPPMAIVTAQNNIPDFRSLRPCVAIAGRMAATVR